LLVAATLPDLLFCLLLAAGVEDVRIQPGITAVNALDLYDIGVSHSLVLDIVWGALFAGLYLWQRGNARAAYLLFALVVSHWLLDFVSHRPDMPLAPWVDRYFGLGLWDSRAATFVVEGLMWAVSIGLYMRATRPLRRAGTLGFWPVIAALTAIWLLSLTGAPPPGVRAVVVVNTIFFCAVAAWAFWIDRQRIIRERHGPACPRQPSRMRSGLSAP
jgi:hypothetical protein